MEEALENARCKDGKERMAAMEHLHQLLESYTKALTTSEISSLVECCLDLLNDSNFRVSQCSLQALASAAVLSGENLKLHFNNLVPAVVERLGDSKQPVRDAARRLLLTLMEISSPTIIVERAGNYAWTNKNWRVREEFARTVSSAMNLFATTELTLHRVLLPFVLQLLNDPNFLVREASILCIEEMYTQIGPQFHDELQRHHLPISLMKDINAKLEKIEPKIRQDGLADHFIQMDLRASGPNKKRSSPKVKKTREISLFGGENDAADKVIEPIKVFSEKELTREIEKVISNLVPEKDWSLRLAAMQNVEGLVRGGAADYPSFPSLLKQLVPPLSNQLLDRRSSIVKQACQLLCFLSKEMLGDFEACAELFIPVLFKLVVITVLVIAESADNCIKTMLSNCKVARILPRIADCAKNDRNSVLRARCCEYALLILEYWVDAPEIQKSADLYEDLIRCCTSDAISEVRSTARMCYRMFAKTWPAHSRHFFSSLDPAIQRLIHDEEGSIHRRYASPSFRERDLQSSRTPSYEPTPLSLPGYGTSSIVAMDKSASLTSRTPLSSDLLLSQRKSLANGTEQSLETMLNASKQKVTAIENLLRGSATSKHNLSVRSACFDLGVDPPSARDPPVPSEVPVTGHLSSLQDKVLASSTVPNAAKVKRTSERMAEGISIKENIDTKMLKPVSNVNLNRQLLEASCKDSNISDSHNSHIPNFQRPLVRKYPSSRASLSRNSFDDNRFILNEMSAYMDDPPSLNDVLCEGLSPSSDWSARVSAFNYIRSLMQQGPKGTQEIIQNFERVMKLFFQHLEDPHHKVAQAALSTLCEIIPCFKKSFESYLERIVPRVFSRLIDPKESVRRPCFMTLGNLSKTYGIDSLLPALLRSFDEQRSPKAKLAVIEFANTSFNKHAGNGEGSGTGGLLKIWLGKLAPLVKEKNMKMKEASVTGIISIYSHFDSTFVLNFIVSMPVEEQNAMRRVLKQYTPRIEVDLMNFLQNKKERQRSKSFYEHSDVGMNSEEGYMMMSKKNQVLSRFSTGSIDTEGGKKWNSMQEMSNMSSGSDEIKESLYHNKDVESNIEVVIPKDEGHNKNHAMEGHVGLQKGFVGDFELACFDGPISTPRLNINGVFGVNINVDQASKDFGVDSENYSGEILGRELHIVDTSSSSDLAPSIPQLLHKICSGNNKDSSLIKHEALLELIDLSVSKDQSIWSKHFNQILTAVLGVLDDADSSVREQCLSLINEMLNNQKGSMEDSIEIVIEKLLAATKDTVAKVSNEADRCLAVVLSQYDALRCITVVVPLLASEDEKTLVTCINCLTKLVGRFSQEDLMSHLSSFLPALFDAFGNQSADVRKTVVFCLVDIYIILGKAFLPYLEGLNSTQLKLVTIYANRISQARSGTTIEDNIG